MDVEALVEKFKKGDYEAFEELVTHFEKRIYNFALRILSDPADAEEALQETFLSVYKNIGKYVYNGGFSRWLYKIATNHCLKKISDKKAQVAFYLDDPLLLEDSLAKREIADFSEMPDDVLMNGEVRELVNKAISMLPEKYRVVLLLHDVEELSNNEIAEVLGLSLPAVKSRLHRARLFIRGELFDYLKVDKPIMAILPDPFELYLTTCQHRLA